MRKFIFLAITIIASVTTTNAQVRNIANHLGVGVGVGTEGINISAATCFTDFVEAELGVNLMPGFSVNKSAAVHFTKAGGDATGSDMTIKASAARTSFDLKASVYPFGLANNFFVAAGISFGGKKAVKMTGTCTGQDFEDTDNPYIKVGQYQVPLVDNHDGTFSVNADARVHSVRPYLGVGYGRLIPKGRLGFRVELGCQFHGKAKIYKNDEEADYLKNGVKDDEDVKKLINNLTVYPVLKFSIRGKIL